MKAIDLVQLTVLVTSLPLTTANQIDCPPWFFPDAEYGTECVCSSEETAKVLKCSKGDVLLRIGICMTYNNETKDTEIGPCPYISQSSNFIVDNLYLRLPKVTSNLTSFMCGSLHRKDLLCGECEDGFGPALYSYTLECKRCWGHGYGWLLYITLTVLPTTVLYFIVVLFHFSVTSPPLNVFVFFCHIAVYTFRTQPDLYLLCADELGEFSHGLLKVMLALCGLWNLDFFRPLVPPFCVNPNMKNLHAFALEYIEAFYPLILILITYICIKLHDHNFRPVVLLWKPFHRCFVNFRSSWDSEASIISAFATFLLLSFSKILFVSFIMLLSTKAKLINRNCTLTESEHFLYYDSTVRVYSKDHLPFAVVSVFIVLVFVVLPTFLLILYPTRVFRKCITCCGFRRWHALHTFMEAFQGQYKDGTDGTWDFRIVSALYLIFRIAVLLAYSDKHHNFDHAYRWLTTAVIFVSTSLFFAIVRPYKVNHLNTIDTVFLALMSIQVLIILFIKYLPNQRYSHVIGVTGLLTMGIPHAALVFYIMCIISKKIRILQHLKRKCRCLKSILCQNKHSQVEGLDTDSLPDRLVKPDEYDPLIPTVNHKELPDESYAMLH